MGTKGHTSGIVRCGAVVRRAGRSDVHAIASLWMRSGLEGSVREFRNEIARIRRRDPELLLIALRNGVAIGAVAGSYDGRTAIISRLAVDREVRRQGVGGELVRVLLRQLVALGADARVMVVLDDDPALEPFWQSLGFVRGRPATRFTRPDGD